MRSKIRTSSGEKRDLPPITYKKTVSAKLLYCRYGNVKCYYFVGTAPENIRHFIELRGIGIINARRIFGMGAVKLTEKIDMVINLEIWDKTKVYDRMGMENEYTEILGLRVPVLTIPVKPGRNLAVIIEVAAMNNRQKKMGYNAAKELLQNLGMTYNDDDNGNPKINWNL